MNKRLNNSSLIDAQKSGSIVSNIKIRNSFHKADLCPKQDGIRKYDIKRHRVAAIYLTLAAQKNLALTLL